ncbi:N-acetylmuramoyl-L-alanine amidase [Gracilibacillus orientalis]|uniref:Spore cortex-lytic enzyme n=1 Tax=Gracilibacillus orientalis TaxID=334253 RepID=A0A1I4L0U3_9BACI|nr:spore cortex-lytic enzyme [Gracilibacillus orientalis]SFL84614.1 N-acetylmuramoyl-L-alanine amidase [Gracilibacillus orientalis]
MKKKITICLIIFTISSFFFIDGKDNQVHGFSNQVVQHGATGDDVIELQARLQYLGFYNGDIDGVFGWGTYWALRNFQYEFGMEIDGLAGQEVKQKLEKASEFDKTYVHEQIQKGKKFTHYGGMDKEKQTEPSPNTTNQQDSQDGDAGQQSKQQGNNQQDQNQSEATEEDLEPTAVNMPQGFSQNDIQIMANAVYGEARGEPFEGQVAVASVILNRVESSTFPNTVSGVIFEPRAFTAVSDGQIWLTPNDNAKRAVLDAINGWDPTGEALYYFNPDTATSDWIWSRQQIKRIGKHIFCI